MTTNDNNYILARWRDAITDPPASGWCGLNTMANGSRYYGACGYMPGDQWLDITTIPGVAREAVQAAVDEMERGEGEADEAVKKSDRETDRCYRGGIRTCLGLLRDHTGVTPTEVTP